MNRTSKIAIISGIVAIVIIATALTVHFRLSETEKSEIESGFEQNEKESASEIANEIVNSLQNKPETTENENTQIENAPNTSEVQTEISITEIDEVYRWTGTDKINPDISLKVNTDNVIQITNPTDEKHEFIIEMDGKEFASSGNIEPDSSSKLTIKPIQTGVFEYHCEYHPDTMKGILNVEP